MDRPLPVRNPSLRLAVGAAALLIAVTLATVASAAVTSGALATTTAPAPTAPPLTTSTNPPACRITDKTTRFTRTADWSRTLLDWTLRLPSTYRPTDLVAVSQAGLGGGGYVRRVMLADLRAMAAAARAAGAPLAVQSAYRSYTTQISTFNYWVSVFGYSRAIVGSARAGHSEHQLGTAIDFRSYGGGVPWSFGGFDWATTRAGAWMARNAWRYGFVLSYPKGKQTTVCYGYEPWHYRYYGRTVAAAIHASGLTTRTWLWRHGNNPGAVIATPPPSPTPSPVPSEPASDTPPPSAPTDSPSGGASAEPSPSPSPPDEPTASASQAGSGTTSLDASPAPSDPGGASPVVDPTPPSP